MTTSKVMCLAVLAILPILGSLAKTIPAENLALGTHVESIEIPDGKVLGTINKTEDKQHKFYAFRGIPYAQPPLGNLRFTAPVKNSKWEGYWDATQDTVECVQGSDDAVRGTEDCLFVNVYTPNVKKNANLPVMVWVHGGGFYGGSSAYSVFGPDYILEQDVVFVSFNYRLGIFGFLSTEDTVASGNWGLKDQVLALQWVKDNIKYFGGNPDKVTIFGESAGAASVSYLLQIPKAKGLFHAAIMQSGVSEMLWALNTRAKDLCFQVGRNLGIIALRSNTLVEKLKNVEAYRLQKAAQTRHNRVLLLNPFRGLPFAPVQEVETEHAVFTEKSDDYLRSGRYPSKVPTLIGYNSNEGGAAHGLPETLRTFLFLADNENLAPFGLTSTSQLRNLAANEVRLWYFGVNKLKDQFHQVVKFINTDQFNRASIRQAENLAQYAPVYFYVFGYEGQIVGNNTYAGVGHAEDLVYLFSNYVQNNNWSSKDLEVRAKLIKLWTNFAKSFNPTPKKEKLLDNVIWKPVDAKSKNLDFVWINQTISLDKNPDSDCYNFYKTVFDQFGDQTYTTY